VRPIVKWVTFRISKPEARKHHATAALDGAGSSQVSFPVRWWPVYHTLVRRLTILAVALLLLLFAGQELYYIWYNLRIRNIWFGDFLAIFDCVRFPMIYRATDIYDRSSLDAYQQALAASQHYPCPYPPSFFLLIGPIGLIGFYPAYAAWIVGTFALYLAVSWYREQPRSATFIMFFAPATTLNFAFGQTGFLTSALMVGGFRFIASRPVLSGVLFGLLSIKPQLGILIPIALISARHWRTLAAAGLTVLVLVLASGAAFGWSVWPLWLSQLLTHADWVATSKPQYMPTIIANLTFLGVDLPVALGVQLVLAVVVAGITWVCFRRGVTNLGTSAVLVGTFLATPYAFVYDMPMVTNAILAVVREEWRMNRRLPMIEAFILAWSLVLPMLMLETWRPGAVRTIPLILLFGLIVWRMFAARGYVAETGTALPDGKVLD
jgi:Glycosyltransferase family 87